MTKHSLRNGVSVVAATALALMASGATSAARPASTPPESTVPSSSPAGSATPGSTMAPGALADLLPPEIAAAGELKVATSLYPPVTFYEEDGADPHRVRLRDHRGDRHPPRRQHRLERDRLRQHHARHRVGPVRLRHRPQRHRRTGAGRRLRDRVPRWHLDHGADRQPRLDRRSRGPVRPNRRRHQREHAGRPRQHPEHGVHRRR